MTNDNSTVTTHGEKAPSATAKIITAFAVFFASTFLGIIILAIGRYIFLLNFAPTATEQISDAEISAFIKTSLLFDAKFSATVFMPLLAAGFMMFVPSLVKYYRKTACFLSYLGIMILLSLTVVQHYYYETYKQAISTFIFALFREDPLAVLTTIITDYPVLPAIFLIILFMAVYYHAYRSVIAASEKLFGYVSKRLGRISGVLFILVLTAATVFMLRGSVDTFPLRQDNLNVSRNTVINIAVGNGPAHFYWAYKWYRKEGKKPKISVNELIKSFRNNGFETTPENITAPLTVKLPENEFLKNNPPDIVFAIMESMSTHMLLLGDSKYSIDVYGSLKKHVLTDYMFLNFLSEGNGTSDTLMRLFTGAPDMNLSTSSSMDKKFFLNTVRPFKEHGYRVIFITSGRSSWRNIGSFLKAQGVDEVIDESTIREFFPNATSGTWGIDDEYLFRTAYKILTAPHKQPQLIFMLTITNHPPYRVPENVKPQTIPLPKEILQRFPYTNTETIFATFRYANNSLGNFITEVKANPDTAEKTFIVATGDHNLRGIGYNHRFDEVILGHGVPFYMYMPQKYREATGVSYDSYRFGSHKDIMSTVAKHALSGGTMLTLGCDMLSDVDICNYPYSYNDEVGIYKKSSNYMIRNRYADQYVACFIRNNEVNYKYALLDTPRISGLLVDPAKFSNSGEQCNEIENYDQLVHDIYHYNLTLNEKETDVVSSR